MPMQIIEGGRSTSRTYTRPTIGYGGQDPAPSTYAGPTLTYGGAAAAPVSPGWGWATGAGWGDTLSIGTAPMQGPPMAPAAASPVATPAKVQTVGVDPQIRTAGVLSSVLTSMLGQTDTPAPRVQPADFRASVSTGPSMGTILLGIAAVAGLTYYLADG